MTASHAGAPVAPDETAAALLAWGTRALAATGAESPRRAAEILLADSLATTRERLLARPEQPVDAGTSERYRAGVERHGRGEPLAYVLGRREFYGRVFEVSPAVLIPRPETELVVERAVEHLRAAGGSPRFADVGTGSGCIAVTLAAELTDARGWAVDLDPRALAVAARNAARHRVADRIAFVAADLLAAVRGDLDLVVSNPPYVPRAASGAVQRSVREHEPHLALFGGDSGLEVFRVLVPQAAARLRAGGILALEIGMGQADAVLDVVKRAGLEPLEVVPDLQGIPRCVVARTPNERRIE